MQVFPVIDVKNGEVVHARGGERSSYRPIITPLAAGSEPVAIAKGLMALHRFPVVYVADLDGITSSCPDLTTIQRLSRALPDARLWVDNGANVPAAVEELLTDARVTAVIGSETLAGADAFAELYARHGNRLVLSLDFRGETFLGPEQILHDTRFWPDVVIAMTLAAVGGGSGPDIARVSKLKSLSSTTSIVAAGGIRNKDDLVALAQAGADAALVASALHAGTLKAGDLEEIAGLQQ